MTTIHLDPKDVPAVITRGYRGKKFRAVVVESLTIPSDAGLWSGGSRNAFQAIDLATGEISGLSFAASAPWDNERREVTIKLVPGKVIVNSVMFQGKDLGLRIYVHPDDARKLLPAPSAKLSPQQRVVLLATSRFKSHHNGQDRFDMAARDYDCKRICEVFPSRDEWNAAKAELIMSGHLNKAGAITVKGRNAAK